VYYFQDDTESAQDWIMGQLKKDDLLWCFLSRPGQKTKDN
jgi:hypothetical protein